MPIATAPYNTYWVFTRGWQTDVIKFKNKHCAQVISKIEIDQWNAKSSKSNHKEFNHVIHVLMKSHYAHVLNNATTIMPK